MTDQNPMPKPSQEPSPPLADGGGMHSLSNLVVLLFTDIVSSMALKARLGGPAYERILARQHEIVQHTARTADANVSILNDTGDGLLIGFSSASRAVRAALRIQRLIHGEDWAALDLQPGLQLRIGIHVGQIGRLESKESADAIPKFVGLPIDIAARVTALARPGQILMTRPIYEDAEQRLKGDTTSELADIEWKSHGWFTLKGREEPIELLEVGVAGIAPFEVPEVSADSGAQRASRPP